MWLLGVVVMACVFPSIIIVPYRVVHCWVIFLWLVRMVLIESFASWDTLFGRGAKTSLPVGCGSLLFVPTRSVVVPRLLVLSMVSFEKLASSPPISACALVVWVASRVRQFSFGLTSRMVVPRWRTWGTSRGETFFLVFGL